MSAEAVPVPASRVRLSAVNWRQEAGAEGDCSAWPLSTPKSPRACENTLSNPGSEAQLGLNMRSNRIRGAAGSRLQLPGVLKRANPGHGLIRPVSSAAEERAAGG